MSSSLMMAGEGVERERERKEDYLSLNTFSLTFSSHGELTVSWFIYILLRLNKSNLMKPSNV